MTNHIARRRSYSIQHVVQTSRWYSGMTATTVCGVRGADVYEFPADPKSALLCKRCAKIVDWEAADEPPYIPSTYQIERCYIWLRTQADGVSREDARAEFQRWLNDHDRRVLAEPPLNVTVVK